MGEQRGIRIAIEGCCHGELDKIYETMQHLEEREGIKIDLLICCGDFQAVRNLDDLECMACPPKYRSLQSFYKYYSGQLKPPYPTLFIGGNHEAINYLWELYHGGWAAPDIYFLGYAGVIRFGGIRIGGLSGIYKQHDYWAGHFEKPPYTESTMRSAYHVRALEIHRLLRLSGKLDVFLSHDWPQGIAHHGDTSALLRKKTFLRREVEDGSLGSPANAELMRKLKPEYWFSAHLHTKFAAVYDHPPDSPEAPAMKTRFLSLDKCLPGRGFLQVVEFTDATGPPVFEYDPEWLAILRATHSLTNLHPRPPPPPAATPSPSLEEVTAVEELLAARGEGGARIPHKFVPTAPAHVDEQQQQLGGGMGRPVRGKMPQQALKNPQTVQLLELLGLDYNLEHRARPPPPPSTLAAAAPSVLVISNPEEIDLGDGMENEPDGVTNPEEIYLGDLEHEEEKVQNDNEAVDPALAAVLNA